LVDEACPTVPCDRVGSLAVVADPVDLVDLPGIIDGPDPY
jgi:hypothetical protein